MAKAKADKKQGLLVNVARTIGSTLGSVAAKAHKVSKPDKKSASAKKTSAKSRKTKKSK
jgi:hypothetical protein